MKLLWLDDMRDPHTNDWLVFSPIPKMDIIEVIWVKSFNDFCLWIHYNGLPDGICFDNSLGEEKTGYDCAKWLVNYCLDNNKELPLWNCQSSEPHSRELIDTLLNNFKKRLT